MNKMVPLAALLLSSASAWAQTNFRPGYVLPLSGDTLRGEVDFRGERRNAALCRFRPAAGDASVEYKPEQLRGYGFSGGRDYQSQPLPTGAYSPVFVQVLVAGKASVYRFTTEDDEELYYAQASAAPTLQPLIQRDTTITEVNPQTRSETKTRTRLYPFRNVLWTLMADCPAVQTTLTHAELTESYLVKTFSAYNACAGGTQYVAKKRPTQVRFSVFAGGYQADVNFQADVEKTLHSAMRPTYGIGMQIQPGSFNYHLSLVAQAQYVTQEYSAYYSGNGTLGPGYERSVKVSLASVRVPLLLRYSFTKGIIRPYIQAGGIFALNTRREGERTDSYPRFSSDVTVMPVDLRSYGIGGMVGLGISVPTGQVGSINLEARVDKFDNTSEVSGLLSGAQGFSLLAGYTFGKP